MADLNSFTQQKQVAAPVTPILRDERQRKLRKNKETNSTAIMLWPPKKRTEDKRQQNTKAQKQKL